jgi:hypothetical protein
MRTRRPMAGVMFGIGICVMAMPTSASAQTRRALPGSDYGYATAESRYGTGVVAAPVRRGPHGRLEVRLPGGTWIECGRSCSETLRMETVDFWQSRGRFGDRGPGYLRFGY